MRRPGGFIASEPYCYEHIPNEERTPIIIWGTAIYDAKTIKYKNRKGDSQYTHFGIKYAQSSFVQIRTYTICPSSEVASHIKAGDRVIVVGELLKRKRMVDGHPLETKWIETFLLFSQRSIATMDLVEASPKIWSLLQDEMESAGDYEDAGLQEHQDV